MKTDKGNFLIQSNLASIAAIDVYAKMDAVRTKLVALGCTFDMVDHDAVRVTVPRGKEFEAEAIYAELFPGVTGEQLVAVAGQLEPIRCSNTIQKAPCPNGATWIGTYRFAGAARPDEAPFCEACAAALKACMPGGFAAWRSVPGAAFVVSLDPDTTRKLKPKPTDNLKYSPALRTRMKGVLARIIADRAGQLGEIQHHALLAIYENIVRGAAAYWDTPLVRVEDFEVLSSGDGYVVFGGVGGNQLRWTAAEGYQPVPGQCTAEYIKHCQKIGPLPGGAPWSPI